MQTVRSNNIVNTIYQKTNNQKPIKGILSILVIDVFGFVDVLIEFWGQKVKRQGHNRQ